MTLRQDERGFVGAEKALLLVCALAILLVGGLLVRGGSEQAARDACRTLGACGPMPTRDAPPRPLLAPASLARASRLGPPSFYPDPALTPGAVLPGVTAAEVCKPGYSRGVRNVPPAEKAQVFKRYGVKDVPGAYEVDHFVSLELGGSNDISNLWPEPYAPAPGAREKDKVENYLHAQVCSGAMTLAQAQDAIRSDWYAVYRKAFGGSS